LDGVTRKSLIALAEKMGIDVKIQPVLVSELIEAAKNGSLKEVFGSGTAAVVNPIIGFAYQDDYYELPKIEKSMALMLKEELVHIQYNMTEDPFDWKVKI
jgi:branched-chain amino acid aminotransferase